MSTSNTDPEDWADQSGNVPTKRSKLTFIHDDEDGIGVIYDPENPKSYVMADDNWVVELGGGSR